MERNTMLAKINTYKHNHTPDSSLPKVEYKNKLKWKCYLQDSERTNKMKFEISLRTGHAKQNSLIF